MDDLALDLATLDAQLDGRALVEPSGTPWQRRRAMAFGASDVPAVLLALARRSGDCPRYIAEKAEPVRVPGGIGVARIFAEKAGLVAPKRVGSAAAKGTKRERELLVQWRMRLEHQQYYCDAERLLVPESIQHADDAPLEWYPLVDRHCPALTCTPDAWCRDVLGQLVGIELKCSATERRQLPWWWRDQKMAQLAVTGEAYGLLVCGEFWAAWHGNDGTIRAWPVERDEDAIAEVREACTTGWEMVEELKSAG